MTHSRHMYPDTRVPTSMAAKCHMSTQCSPHTSAHPLSIKEKNQCPREANTPWKHLTPALTASQKYSGQHQPSSRRHQRSSHLHATFTRAPLPEPYCTPSNPFTSGIQLEQPTGLWQLQAAAAIRILAGLPSHTCKDALHRWARWRERIRRGQKGEERQEQRHLPESRKRDSDTKGVLRGKCQAGG